MKLLIVFAAGALLPAAAWAQQGQVNIICSVQADWCNLIQTVFAKSTGIKVNMTLKGSGEALAQLIAEKANPKTDVWFGGTGDPHLQAAEQDLSLEYKSAALKDLHGWAQAQAAQSGYKTVGIYSGPLGFGYNTELIAKKKIGIPKSWADLLKPEYKGQVALAGDPRKSSQAINAVYAAGLANGGSLDDATKGLDFFTQLNKAGNFVPVIAKPATIAKGETPIAIRWDYNALANRDASNGNPTIEVVVPKSGVLAGTYVQAISAFAPHPNAAKLWMEYLYSDEGQNIWLKGYAHPIRFADMVKRNVIPADLMKKLPDAAGYANAAFPTNDQLTTSKKTITEGWDKMVGADVK